MLHIQHTKGFLIGITLLVYGYCILIAGIGNDTVDCTVFRGMDLAIGSSLMLTLMEKT